MCTDEDYKKIKLYGPSLWTGFTCLHILCHYWAVDYSPEPNCRGGYNSKFLKKIPPISIY